jgi:Phage P2 GpU.
MIVGALGDVVFSVSSKTLLTLSNFKWSGSSRYATFQRHNHHALTEYTGMDADQISFDIYLSAYFGKDVQEEIAKIWKYERDGQSVPLVIGDHGYGKWRWVVKAHSLKAQTFDGRGNIMTATVNLQLLEYLSI